MAQRGRNLWDFGNEGRGGKSGEKGQWERLGSECRVVRVIPHSYGTSPSIHDLKFSRFILLTIVQVKVGLYILHEVRKINAFDKFT